jgi:hypothetical protein
VVGAVAAVAINATPSARARRQANEVAELVTPEIMNESLAAKLRAVAAAPQDGVVTISDVVVTQKVTTPGELADPWSSRPPTRVGDSSVLRWLAWRPTRTRRSLHVAVQLREDAAQVRDDGPALPQHVHLLSRPAARAA